MGSHARRWYSEVEWGIGIGEVDLVEWTLRGAKTFFVLFIRTFLNSRGPYSRYCYAPYIGEIFRDDKCRGITSSPLYNADVHRN